MTAPGAGDAAGGVDAAALARELDELSRQAGLLEDRLTAELGALDEALGAGSDGPAEPPWQVIAEHVHPLSRKAPGAGPQERRLAALDRQYTRLLREGAALGDQARALRQAGADLKRDSGGTAAAWRRDVLAWAAELSVQQRRMASWGDALATYQRHRRARREGH